MNVIILVALIFVILSLANKYLKVPRDNNQRYDGINNRFYGEGNTGDIPVPPADDNGAENDQEDPQGEKPGDQQEEWQDGQTDYGEKQPENTTGGEASGVVIDTEVRVDTEMPQDSGKS